MLTEDAMTFNYRHDPYTRRAHRQPGFDCPRGNCPACATGRRDNHGIGSEQWYFTAIVKDAALTLNVSTPFYPETVKSSPNEYSCRGLDLCLAWPTSSALIAGAALPDDCAYIGKCYPGDGISLLGSDKFFEAHFDKAAGFEQTDRFWDGLYRLLQYLTDAATPARTLRQCKCCGGTGVVTESGC
jgi:hypothetical protein